MQRLLLRFDFAFMLLVGLGAISLVFYISYFGAPVTDESFPIATALRFIQGQKPFIDDYSPYIPIGLLLLPIIKLSMFLHDGKNELILFLRHAYIAFSLIVAGYTFLLNKKCMDKSAAFFIAMAMVIFHAFGINNFHYDTLSVLLWTSLLFQLHFIYDQDRVKSYHYLIFSLTNLLLVFSYPTFIFFLIPFYFIVTPFYKNYKAIWSYHILVSVLTAVTLVVLFFYVLQITTADVLSALHFSHQLFKLSTHDGTIATKFLVVLKKLFLQYKTYCFFALIALLISCLFHKNSLIIVAGLIFSIAAPLYSINLSASAYLQSFYFLNCIGLLGFMQFYLFLHKDKNCKKLFYFVWIPAFLAGLVTSTTSYNREMNFIIGFFPAALVSVIFLLKIINDFAGQIIKQIFSKLILLYLLMLISFFQYNYIYSSSVLGYELYKDAKLFTINGPFYGLYVQPIWFDLLSELHQDLKSLDQLSSNHYVYFGIFSSAYLMVDHLKPGDYLLYSPYELAHFNMAVKAPSYIFDFSKILNLTDGSINAYLGDLHQKIISGKNYDVYQIVKR